MTEKNNENSLGHEKTVQGESKPKADDLETRSLGDQVTFSGGRAPQRDQSLGDQITVGGGDIIDGGDLGDGMEVVDLSARYKVERTLGKGGMGEVVLATDTRLERKVAIKRILADAARSRAAVNRFLTEAKSIAALNHPNIVQIYDYGRSIDGPFLIMEYVDGNSLLDRCRRGPLPLEEAVELTCQLCDGLAKAHDAGIVHRDIKPANVLMTGDGNPKLTDFGLAKAESADTGMTMAGAILGTLDFMSPEQRRDAALTDARSDLWSLAATLYQMVTGRSPKIIRFNDVPLALQQVLGKALKDAKEDRYQTVREFKEALKKSLRDSGPADELREGECPHCGTKNESSRKFCRKCAQSLEVPCLSCQVKIAMWEEVCGRCGAQQGQLVERRKSEMEAQRARAEQLLAALEFDQALQLAKSLGTEPDLRLQQLKLWSQSFLRQIEVQRGQQLEHAAVLVGEALQHEQAYDYPSAIHALEQVPQSLREAKLADQLETGGSLLRRVSKRQAECRRLEKLIHKRVRARQLNGLLTEVNQLLQLRPGSANVPKLKAQLEERDSKLRQTRDEAAAASAQLCKGHDYEGALRELERIDLSVARDEDTALRQQVEGTLQQVRGLQATITSALQQKKYFGLLQEVEALLGLKPNDQSMQSLRQQLIEREAKNETGVKDIIAKATVLRGKANFDGAVQLLSKIPSELETQASSALRKECTELAWTRNSALGGLNRALASGNYRIGLPEADGYLHSLASERIADDEFQQLYGQCRQNLAAQQEEEQAAARWRKQLRMAGIVGGTAVGLLVVIVLVMSIRSAMRASALASALATAVKAQQWDNALALDATNVTALIGRANKRLTGANPDVPAVFADLALAEQLEPAAEGLKVAKALAYMARADSQARVGKLGEAESDLRTAETLGAPANSPTEARKLLASAYVKQAEESLARQDVSGIRSACDAAERHMAATEELRRLRSEAYRIEGAQKQKSKDYAGALASLEEAVKLNSRMDLNNERATLQVQLGNQAFSRGDYATASQELNAAIGLGGADAAAVNLLKTQLVTALAASFQTSIDKEDYAKAFADYASVTELDSEAAKKLLLSIDLTKLPSDLIANFPPALKARLVTTLAAGFQTSIGKEDYAKAFAVYASVTELDSEAAKKLLLSIDLTNLPSEVLTKLPSDLIATSDVIANRPPLVNKIGMQLKLIPAGEFTMGEGSDAHPVPMSKWFCLGAYEVTQEQYEMIIGDNPSKFKGSNNPVERVSWADAVKFCEKLSELPAERAARRVYRLPTEAEWEYACRAGTTTKFSFGDDESKLGDYAWYDDNSGEKPHPVGQKKPNPWGLYDMHGNMWEWCQDSSTVARGGCWANNAIECRSAFSARNNSKRTDKDSVLCLGFRVVVALR